MASNAYELTPGIVVAGVTTLIAVDDSIVRGTTLRMSMIPRLDSLKPKRIIFVSSAPQVRFPDCYGIDMSRLDNLVAFRAAVELLKERGMENVLHEVYEKCILALRSSAPELRHQNWMKGDTMENPVKEVYAPFTAKEISAKISQLVTSDEVLWRWLDLHHDHHVQSILVVQVVHPHLLLLALLVLFHVILCKTT